MVGNWNLYPLVSGYTSQWCRCKERCSYTSTSVHLHLHAMHINMYIPRPKWSAHSGHCRAPWIYTASESGKLQCTLLIHWSSTLKFQGPLNLHCLRIRAAAVHTPNTLIKYTEISGPPESTLHPNQGSCSAHSWYTDNWSIPWIIRCRHWSLLSGMCTGALNLHIECNKLPSFAVSIWQC